MMHCFLGTRLLEWVRSMPTSGHISLKIPFYHTNTLTTPFYTSRIGINIRFLHRADLSGESSQLFRISIVVFPHPYRLGAKFA